MPKYLVLKDQKNSRCLRPGTEIPGAPEGAERPRQNFCFNWTTLTKIHLSWKYVRFFVKMYQETYIHTDRRLLKLIFRRKLENSFHCS